MIILILWLSPEQQVPGAMKFRSNILETWGRFKRHYKEALAHLEHTSLATNFLASFPHSLLAEIYLQPVLLCAGQKTNLKAFKTYIWHVRGATWSSELLFKHREYYFTGRCSLWCTSRSRFVWDTQINSSICILIEDGLFRPITEEITKKSIQLSVSCSNLTKNWPTSMAVRFTYLAYAILSRKAIV